MYNNIFNIVRVGRVNVNKIIIATALLMRLAKLLLLRAKCHAYFLVVF